MCYEENYFFDRDGTLIWDPPDEKVDSLEKLKILPGVVHGLSALRDAGFELVMVTNQEYVGTPAFPTEAFEEPQRKLLEVLARERIYFAEIFICTHTVEENCECRKPKTGLLKEYLESNSIDRVHSFVIGDRETDVQIARNIGCKAVRLAGGVTSEANFVTPDFLEASRFILQENMPPN